MIDVCFITDDGYVLPTMTAIQSLIESQNIDNLAVHVVCDSVNEENISSLKLFEKKIPNFEIKEIENPYSDVDTQHFYVSKSAMIKFALPQIFKNLDKILYIDGDMLILNTLDKLFSIDIKNVYACVVADMRAMVDGNHHKYNLKKYFNSGMMLLNLKYMRDNNITQKLIENKKNDTFKHFMDQDTLNQTFNERVIWASPKYNLMKANLNYNIEQIAEFYKFKTDEMKEILNRPTILHLTNKKKPWKTINAPCFDVWYSYFTKLPKCNLKCKKEVEIKKQVKYNNKLKNVANNSIISLTSFPARINTVHQTVETLIKQTIKPKNIVLWLTKSQFPNGYNDLPDTLLQLQQKGLIIEWYDEQIKSYTKLIPSLKKYPNSIIVTADDDILYNENWFELLLESYLKNKNMIHVHRAHYILFNNNQILPYNKWQWAVSNPLPCFNNFLTGVGGVLYPPKSLYKDIFKTNLFIKLSPNNDDIWFWAMAVLNGTKINVIENNISKLNYVEGTQEGICLCKSNCNENQNDVQLKKVLEYYPQIEKKLNKKHFNDKNKLLKDERVYKIKLFNFIPIFGIKKTSRRKVYKILGLPILKIRKKPNSTTTKYYVLGIPFLKVSKKG